MKESNECCFDKLYTVLANTLFGFNVLSERDNKMANLSKKGKSSKLVTLLEFTSVDESVDDDILWNVRVEQGIIATRGQLCRALCAKGVTDFLMGGVSRIFV